MTLVSVARRFDLHLSGECGVEVALATFVRDNTLLRALTLLRDPEAEQHNYLRRWHSRAFSFPSSLRKPAQ